jgi:predicted AlkP superfamily phosphohydrolase/phosphomutase
MSKTKVLLIGLDGATFTILDPLMKQGKMPFLRQFMSCGLRSELKSTIPHVSPVAWTSLATGCRPGEHGVFDFIKADENSSSGYFTLYNANDIRRETIWSMLTRQGRRVSVLNYMLTFPLSRLNGYVVPGLSSWRHYKRGVRPAEFYEFLKNHPGLDIKSMAWDFDLEKKVLGQLDPSEYEGFIRFHIERERQWFRVAVHLLKTDPTDLLAVVFDGSDKLSHVCWRFLDPEFADEVTSEWELHIHSLCIDYFRRLDTYLAELVSSVGPDTTVVIVSDHGFGPSQFVFRVNAWLQDRGYLTWRSRESEKLDAATLERRVDSNFAFLDWEKTRAYCRTPSSNGIYIRAGRTDGRLEADEYFSFRARLAAELLDVRDPVSGIPIVSQALTKEQAFGGAEMARAPDLTMVLRDCGFASIRNMQPVVEHRPEVAGTHRPEGILAANGPWVERGALSDSLQIVDVVPLILYAMDAPVPEDLDGRLPIGVIDGSWLASHPPICSTATAPPPRLPPDPAAGLPLDEVKGEEAVLDRLRSLGYIE